MYKVKIVNARTNRTEDNYLIKVEESELAGIEAHIHARYPHSSLNVSILPVCPQCNNTGHSLCNQD